MGLRSKQDNLERNRQQQTNLIEQLTTENSNLQEQVQSLESQNSSLKAELTEAYKKIESLSSSDLQLKEAQQLKASASADLESSKQLLKEQKSLQQLNEKSRRDLESSKKTLEAQKTELKEKENSLQDRIKDAKEQAKKDAKAELADGWKKLEDAKNDIEKEQDDERQRIEDLKAEAEKELAEAQNAKAAAAEKGYQDTVSTYKLAIYAMILCCAVLGLGEIIKHQYIFEVYQSAYISLSDYIGFWLASAVAAVAATIFLAAYFVPLRDSDGLYFGLALRLILLVTLFALAVKDYKEIAAGIIYLSSIIIGVIRWKSA